MRLIWYFRLYRSSLAQNRTLSEVKPSKAIKPKLSRTQGKGTPTWSEGSEKKNVLKQNHPLSSNVGALCKSTPGGAFPAAETISAIVFNEFQQHLTQITFPSDEDNVFWHSEKLYSCFSRLISDCTCHKAKSLSQSPPIALSPLERSCKCILLSEDGSRALLHLYRQACVSVRRTNSSFSQVNTEQKLVVWCCSSPPRYMSVEKCNLTRAKSLK